MPYGTVNVDSVVNSDGVTSGGLYGFKNRLINGAMGIWQRGTSFSSFSSGANTYTADRFASFVGGTGGTIAVTQQAVTPTTFTALGAQQDPQYYLQYQCSVLGSTTYMDLNQRIEDVRTFAGQNVTISFYAKADTTRTVAVSTYQNFGSGGSSDVGGSSTNVTLTSSWARYTVTLACGSISGKTIGSGSWVGIVFGLPVSTFTISMALIQAEYGSTATSFDYRPYGTELALCQRYYTKFIALSGAYAGIGCGVAESVSGASIVVKYPVTMRSAPSAGYSTLGLYDASGIRPVTSLSTNYQGNDALNINVVASGGGLTTGRAATFITNGSAGYFELSSEL